MPPLSFYLYIEDCHNMFNSLALVWGAFPSLCLYEERFCFISCDADSEWGTFPTLPLKEKIFLQILLVLIYFLNGELQCL